MFIGKQTRAGRKDQVTVGVPTEGRQGNTQQRTRQQSPSTSQQRSSQSGDIVISTEARMPEHTEINDPTTIAGQQVLVGGVDGADRPRNWQEFEFCFGSKGSKDNFVG